MITSVIAFICTVCFIYVVALPDPKSPAAVKIVITLMLIWGVINVVMLLMS